MKTKLLLACSAACAALATGLAARAQIDGETGDPVSSSTIDGGAPGDVVVTEDGSIEAVEEDGFTAITLDSDNDVDMGGLVSLEDSDDATGVLIEGGVAGALRVSGDIELLEDYTRPETDDEITTYGPYAVGEGRAGIWLSGPGGFDGDIVLESGAGIDVEGNDSFGVRLDSRLDGDFVSDGTISVLGDNAVAVDIRDGAGGTVLQSGTVSSRGENARGVVVLGDVGGAFVNEGAVTVTGFASTSVTNYADPDDLDEDDTPIEDRIHEDNLLDGGAAVSIGGSVADGFLNNGAVGGEDDEDDDDKDTIEDFDENRSQGAIRSYGSGEAVLISADLDSGASGDLVLGPVVEQVRDTTDDDDDDNIEEIIASFDYDEGFINRGVIAANGLNVGFEATALRIEGAADGGRATIIEGGLRNAGSIAADAFEADATALSFGAGAQTPRLYNTGVIEATVRTEDDHAARALLIEEGGDLGRIDNLATIVAEVRGYEGRAVAIEDRSGSLLDIRNQRTIAARFIDDGAVNEGEGATIAVDLSRHGADEGARLIQSRASYDDAPTPAIIGDVLFGAGGDRFDIREGTVDGDVSFGGGNDALRVSDAALRGAIDLGAGTDSASFSDGAYFRGSIRDADGAGALSIDDSTVEFENVSPLTVDTLDIGGGAQISFATGEVDEEVALITATSRARLDSDTEIGVSVTEFRAGQRSFLLIESGDLVIEGDGDLDVAVNVPAIFNSEAAVSDTALSVTLNTKSSADLGLNANESAAYASFLALAEQEETIGDSLTSYMAEDELVADYAELLPDYADAATRFLSAESSIVGGSVGRRFDQLRKGADASHGFWLMEQTSYIREKEGAERVGYDGLGVSFDGGYDYSLTDNIVVGASAAARIAKYKTPDNRSGEAGVTAYQAGVYASAGFGGFALDIAGGAGIASLDSKRLISFGDAVGLYEGDTDATFWSASARAAYRFEAGNYYVEPTAAIDYFRMNQDGYEETALDAEAPLALRLGDATTGRASGTALLRFGRHGAGGRQGRYSGLDQAAQSFGQTRFFQDFYAGYRMGLDETLYSAAAGFIALEEGFEIADLDGYDDAFVGGVALGAAGPGYVLSFNYDGEFEDAVMVHRFGAVFRLAF